VSLSENIIAVYGGTFDPFHNGHEAICNQVLRNINVAKLVVVPCHIPALKANASESALDRLEMLRCWRSSHKEKDRIEISEIEIKRGGPSFSFETVTTIAQENKDASITFVMGADAWNSLPLWNEYKQLIQISSFWVFVRSMQQSPKKHPFLSQQENEFDTAPGTYLLDDSINLPISSSQIRENKTEFESLPESIVQYIKQHHLYNR